MVPPARFELATLTLEPSCSNPLSYGGSSQWPVGFCKPLDAGLLQPFGIAPLDKTNRLKPSDCFVGGAKAPQERHVYSNRSSLYIEQVTALAVY